MLDVSCRLWVFLIRRFYSELSRCDIVWTRIYFYMISIFQPKPYICHGFQHSPLLDTLDFNDFQKIGVSSVIRLLYDTI